ncbi:MAG: metal ABC transporter permease [Caldimicrobium sp.]|nr:metal ABC transporter permease [Caldimicrobium sp.]MCX7873872.1 metal ABC transporter permease [Caldimicrobium sp.]MDW8094749.1 metal ABC transporter permease [Caldimicrobium sp.]
MEALYSYLDLFKWGLLAGVTFALSSAITSPFLILQRNALFPHALTHLLLFSILCLSIIEPFIPPWLQFPFLLVITLLIASFIHLLTAKIKLYEDTATSLTTHLFLGLALFLASITSQYNITLLHYLFGSLMMIDFKNVLEGCLVLLATIIFYFKYASLWLTKSIDREVPGLDLKKGELLLLLVITLQILVGVKLMGVLLVSAFFVFGTSLALKISPSFKQVIPFTSVFNIMAILGGIFLSLLLDIPFSASVIIFMSLYVLGLFFTTRK